MLKQRVITAIIVTLFVMAMLFGLPAIYFPWFIAAVVLLGAYEWANLSGCGKPWQRCLYLAVMAVLLVGVSCYIGLCSAGELQLTKVQLNGVQLNGVHLNEVQLNTEAVQQVLIVACAWWALALLLVQGYPSSAILWGHPLLRLLMGVLVLAPTWLALTFVRFQPEGAWLVVMIIAMVAAADTGGYFSGRRFGKHKLAPAVSPGKTWEGFFGGLFCNILLAVIIADISGSSVWLLLAIVIPTSLFSVLGDLLESMVKRHAGIKDSGRILPGHGGILDRVDSITAAAPIFALALVASNWRPV